MGSSARWELVRDRLAADVRATEEELSDLDRRVITREVVRYVLSRRRACTTRNKREFHPLARCAREAHQTLLGSIHAAMQRAERTNP